MKWIGFAVGLLALVGVIFWAVLDVREQESQTSATQLVLRATGDTERDAETNAHVQEVPTLGAVADRLVDAGRREDAAQPGHAVDGEVGAVQGEFRRGPHDARTARELKVLERVDAFVTRAGVTKSAAQELTAVLLEEDTQIRAARGTSDPRSRKRTMIQIRRETDSRAKALLTDAQFQAYRQMRREDAKMLGAGRLGRFRSDANER